MAQGHDTGGNGALDRRAYRRSQRDPIPCRQNPISNRLLAYETEFPGNEHAITSNEIFDLESFPERL